MGVIRFNFFLNQVKKTIPLCIYLVPLLWNFKGKLTFLRHWKTNITSFTLYTLPTNFVSKMSFTLSYHHEIGEKLSDIDGRLDYPLLNKELVLDVKRLWQDPAIQVKTNSHSNLLKLYSFPGQVCWSNALYCRKLTYVEVFCNFLIVHNTSWKIWID